MRPEDVENAVNQMLGEDDLKLLHDNLGKVMGTPEGRSVVGSLFLTFPLYTNAHSGNSSIVSFTLGQQSVSQWLRNRICDAGHKLMFDQMESEMILKNSNIQAKKLKMLEKFKKEGKL